MQEQIEGLEDMELQKKLRSEFSPELFDILKERVEVTKRLLVNAKNEYGYPYEKDQKIEILEAITKEQRVFFDVNPLMFLSKEEYLWDLFHFMRSLEPEPLRKGAAGDKDILAGARALERINEMIDNDTLPDALNLDGVVTEEVLLIAFRAIWAHHENEEGFSNNGGNVAREFFSKLSTVQEMYNLDFNEIISSSTLTNLIESARHKDLWFGVLGNTAYHGFIDRDQVFNRDALVSSFRGFFKKTSTIFHYGYEFAYNFSILDSQKAFDEFPEDEFKMDS